MTTAVAVTTPAPTPVAFDYATDLIEGGDPKDLQWHRKCIQEQIDEIKRVPLRIRDIGSDLVDAKALIIRGKWGAWLASSFGWSERTAQRCMNVYREFGDVESDKLSELNESTLYAVAAKSTPAPVREAIVKRLKAGEKVTDAEIIEEVKVAKAAAKPKPAATSTSTGAPAAPATPRTSSSAPLSERQAIATFWISTLRKAFSGMEADAMIEAFQNALRAGVTAEDVAEMLAAKTSPAASVAPVAAPVDDEATAAEIEAALSDTPADTETAPVGTAETTPDDETIEASAPVETPETETVAGEVEPEAVEVDDDPSTSKRPEIEPLDLAA